MPAFFHPLEQTLNIALDEVPGMASKIFKGMKVFEARRSNFVLRKPAPLDRLITASSGGKRVEIGIDENDVVSVCVFRGDELIAPSMDDVWRALEEDE